MTSIDLNFTGFTSQAGLELADIMGEVSGVDAVRLSEAKNDRFGPAEVSFVLSLILSGGLTLQFLAGVAYSIRQRFRPLVILDFSTDDPKIHVIEGVPGMRGEIVVRTRDGEDVRIEGTDSQSAIISGMQKALGQET